MSYDILFFEALGEENHHLHKELEQAKQRGSIPASLSYYIGTETLQEYLEMHPGADLPDILSTKTHSRLPESWLNSGRKKSVITRSAGYDHFEHLQNVANIASLREYCVNAVAETAVKLMFCVCGNLNQYTCNTATFNRNDCVSFKELSGLKATVFGVGKIGKRTYDMLAGLGLDVRAVDVREKELSQLYGPSVRFVSKDKAIDSQIVICTMSCTRDPASRFYNVNYFDNNYLSRFPDGLAFINVTRGEIAPEDVLWDLYKRGKLCGIGTDVFSGEGKLAQILSGENCAESKAECAGAAMIRAALDRTENIYVQPHQGFNSDKAALAKAEETVRHLEHYFSHGCSGFSAQLPYYK